MIDYGIARNRKLISPRWTYCNLKYVCIINFKYFYHSSYKEMLINSKLRHICIDVDFVWGVLKPSFQDVLKYGHYCYYFAPPTIREQQAHFIPLCVQQSINYNIFYSLAFISSYNNSKSIINTINTDKVINQL